MFILRVEHCGQWSEALQSMTCRRGSQEGPRLQTDVVTPAISSADYTERCGWVGNAKKQRGLDRVRDQWGHLFMESWGA